MYSMFKHKSVNKSKLKTFGFTEQNGTYFFKANILDDQFEMTVEIQPNEEITTNVIDTCTQEPYTLHLVEEATGNFVGRVRGEFEKVLTAIADNCYEKDVFKSKQSHDIINYVSKKYDGELEYLWEKFSSNAVWRRQDNNKWYGALLIISKKKLGLNSDELVDIIDLRAAPETIEEIVDNKKYFAGYHMNKKHWLTICLDGSVPTDEIFDFIDKSYILAEK